MDASRVLVVDDEPFWREALELLLLPEGYDLEFASTGAEALERLGRRRPDLVLLDVMMPGMDGYQVCRTLRGREDLAEVPVVMVTALEDRQSRIAGVEAGADDFVSKPFDRVELRARIRTILKLDRFRRISRERDRFRRLIERSEEGYLVLDPRGRIRFANPTARRLLELPEETPDPFSLDPWMEERFLRRPLEDQDTSGGPAFLLVRPAFPGNPEVWLCLDAPLGPETGEDRVLRVKDVTAEMGLRRSRGTFHSLVNHKLRTPLAAALGSLQLLERRRGAGDPGLQTLSRSLRRLAGEVRDVLEYTSALGLRPSGETFPLEDLPELLERVRLRLGLPRPLEIRAEGIRGLLPLSREALETLFAELLENAVKFHPRRDPRLELEVRLEAERAHLSLRDDGIPLSPEQAARAFHPYFQGEERFTGEVEGMGLGLSLVEVLVLGAGGRCGLGNRPDRSGVQVLLDLPLLGSG